MKNLYYNIFKIGIIIIIIYISLCDGTNRVKRKVIFRKNSKFFIRLNGKEPIFNYTTIFQHGWGFRLNFDLPDSIPNLHKVYKRDINIEIQPYLEKPELKTYLCMMKYFANKYSDMNSEYCGVLCEISKIVKGHTGNDGNFFKDIFRNIKNFDGECPDLKYVLTKYTDI